MQQSKPATAELSASWGRRCGAFLAISLVLLLGAASSSAKLHEWLHTSTDHAGDQCAVILFASGITLAFAVVAAAAPVGAWGEQVVVEVVEVLLAAPRYLRQPERGPPAC